MRRRTLVAVSSEPARARARLAGLARDTEEPHAITPEALEERLEETIAEVQASGGALWIEEGDALASACAARGALVVLARAEDVDALSGTTLRVGGPGIGSVALATIRSRASGRPHGALERAIVRAPAGRRVRPAASRRTAFGRDQRASFALTDEERARIAALATPFLRACEIVVPGAGAALAVSELIAQPGAERIVLHARVGETSVAIEVDREIRGDEEWELEAVFERATLIARFHDGGEALVVRAPLHKPETPIDPRSGDELLVRHLISKREHASAGSIEAARTSKNDCDRALAAAAERLASRPVKIVLVHPPRFRNRFDELRLPSLAIARLAAYLRGYGFVVRVVDLEAACPALDSSPFVDDARVDAWLNGAEDDALAASVEALWAPVAGAIEGRCLVGLSVVDYFGHFQMNLASCIARRVKERTGQPTVLGGERDQVDGDRALRPEAGFDFVVDGDGEAALHELACLVAYGDRDARFVDGVWSRRGERTIKNGLVRSHLNAMPRPDFGGTPLERYRRSPSPSILRMVDAEDLFPGASREPFGYLPYGFVKGCTADCTFCSAKEHLDVQAPEKTVDELLALRDLHGVRDFVLLNNLVNLGKKWLERFCRLLVDAKADLQWTDSCRPTGIDFSLASLMREAGCLLLNFGAESGSDRVLERMQKGLGRADILATLRATHRAGILNRVNLIAGYFHEEERDVDLTISLVEELAGEIDVIGCFQGFYLFEGMGVDPDKEGILLRDEPDRLLTGQATLAYDEIGGLRWEEKRARIDASRNRILARIEELRIRTIDKIDEHDLFWISRLTRDKALVRRLVLADPPPPTRAALPPGGQRGRADAAE